MRSLPVENRLFFLLFINLWSLYYNIRAQRFNLRKQWQTTYRHYQIKPPVSADPLPASDIGNSQINFARVHSDARPPPTYRHCQQAKEGARPINSTQSDVLLNRVLVHTPLRYSPYQTATGFSKPYHAPPATLDYDRFVNQNQPQSGQWSSAREAWLTREALRYEQGQRLPCYYMCTSV